EFVEYDHGADARAYSGGGQLRRFEQGRARQGSLSGERVMSGLAQASGPANLEAILEVRNLEAWYGESHVLHGIDFNVREGEVVTLLGRNGAGKTTTLKSIMGMIGKRKGSVRFG